MKKTDLGGKKKNKKILTKVEKGQKKGERNLWQQFLASKKK